MGAQAVQARLNFLNDSAHLLAGTSPSTSAFLQCRIDQLASGQAPISPIAHDGSPLDVTIAGASLPPTRHLDVCAACGSSLATMPLALESLSTSKNKTGCKSKTSAEKTRRLYVTCKTCNSQTNHELVVPQIDRRARRQVEASMKNPDHRHTASSISASAQGAPPQARTSVNASASSRKRAKARKGSSLSAMLARSKADNDSSKQGFGLDLMDLMKST